MRRSTRLGCALAAASVALTASACGLGTAGGFSPHGTLAGPVARVAPLNGARISVGSKNFTEQVLLGKMLVILLQSAGAKVEDLTNIPGSASARQAMLEGQVDTTVDYTGTGWVSYLGETTPIPDERAQFDAVRDADLAKNGIVWLKPAKANNTYAFATRRDTAAALGVKDLSDLTKVPKSKLTFCVDSEFAARDDGFQPMLKAYGLAYGTDVTAAQVRTMNEGAIYSAVDSGACTFGEVFTTDGRIKALDLVALTDGRDFFPKYNASVVLRKETLDAHPQLRQLLEPLTDRLDNTTLMDLNARIDVDGEEPTQVAWDWLRQQGLVTG